MSGRSRRAVLLLLAVAGVAGLAFVVVRVTAKENVTVVGDSMTVYGGSALRSTANRAGYDLSIKAQAGIPLSARLDVLGQVASSGANRVVVELGTNDVLQGASTEDMFSTIDTAVTELQQVDCVVFVNVGILDSRAPEAAAFNDHLNQAIAAHPNMHLFDWASMYAQHPDWSADHVHLQQPYWPMYAGALVNTLASSCAH